MKTFVTITYYFAGKLFFYFSLNSNRIHYLDFGSLLLLEIEHLMNVFLCEH